MAQREAIVDAISTSLEDLTRIPETKMYLIVETKNKDEPYIFYKINIDGNVPSYFRSTLEKRLHAISEEIRGDAARVKNFFAIHRSPGDIFHIEAADVPDLKWIIDKLAQHPTMTDAFPDMKDLSNIWGFAIDVATVNGKTIYFRKFYESKIIGKANEKGKWTGKLQQGVLTDLQGDVLTFDEQIDCIYFKRAESVLITSIYSRFEMMFDFTDYYVKESKRALGALQGKFLLIDDDLIPKVLKRKRTIQRITKLSKSGVFKDIDSGKITWHFFDGTKKKFGEEEVSYDIFNGKVSVEHVKAVDAFVNACLCKYVMAAAGFEKDGDPQLFTAEYKELFEKVKKAT